MIVLVRHGETDANRAGLLLGRADPPLNATGRAQAEALARRLSGDRAAPIVVVSSPLRRAVETAERIASGWAAAVEIDERLIEMDYGEWDERAVVDVAAGDWWRWRHDPEFAPPGGESLAAVHARAGAGAADLLARAADGSIVAVSHVSPIKSAVAWALDAGPELTWRLRLDVASITRIAKGVDGPVLVTYNEKPR